MILIDDEIADEELRRLCPESFALVDGCFDPLHGGHVAYFRAARERGLPLWLSLAGDDYIHSAKQRSPLLPEAHRAVILEALEMIDTVYVSHHGTHRALERLRPNEYIKGSDWAGQLPEAEVENCARLGVEIVILETPRSSSTHFLERFLDGNRS